MTIYWMNIKTIQNRHLTDLISVGIIDEDGQEYYAINYDCDWTKASNWIKSEVLSKIPEKPLPQLYTSKWDFQDSTSYRQGWRGLYTIGREIIKFFRYSDDIDFGFDENPEIWTFEQVNFQREFYQLFGGLMNLPDGFPVYTMSTNQLAKAQGHPILPKQEEGENHALEDAKHVRRIWQYLKANEIHEYI